MDRLYKVQPLLLKDLRVLHNFKEVNGRNVEDPRNAWITTVIRKGRGSEGVMKMLDEANEALGPLSYFKDDLNSCKDFVVLHLSL